MRLLVPVGIPIEDILEHLRKLPSDVYAHKAQDWVHSRYPSFHHDVLHVDEEWNEIDCTCAICYEKGEYQLDCGHIFHYHCIKQWKQKTCPLCRAPLH